MNQDSPISALSSGDIFFGGRRATGGGGDGEHGGVGRLDALVMSSDCSQDRLVNSASTPKSSVSMVSK